MYCYPTEVISCYIRNISIGFGFEILGRIIILQELEEDAEAKPYTEVY